MASLGALTLSPTAIGFNPKGTAMVPVTTGGGQKLGTISIKSPIFIINIIIILQGMLVIRLYRIHLSILYLRYKIFHI